MYDKLHVLYCSEESENTFLPNLNFSNRLSTHYVSKAISNINTGIGFDGVHSNHLKLASPFMMHIFTMFFNSCLIHNHVPIDMLLGVVRPTPKDRAGNLRLSDNYREVMTSGNLMKAFEYCLLPYLSKLSLSSAQFGYRPNTSTILVNALLKETICNFIETNSVLCMFFRS